MALSDEWWNRWWKEDWSWEGLADEWWDRWWKQDWSWEGLADKPWEGWYVQKSWRAGEPINPVPKDERVGGVDYIEAKLQHYWTRSMQEAGLSKAEFLIKVEKPDWVESDSQQHFTLMHLPPQWRDGGNMSSSLGSRLLLAQNKILSAQIGRSISKTEFEFVGEIKGADHRLQWQGVCVRDFSLRKVSNNQSNESVTVPISLDAEGAYFAGVADFTNAEFLGDADFRQAYFSRELDFSGSCFRDELRFNSAMVCRTASFSKSNFLGYANFADVRFLGDAFFTGSHFAGDAGFSETKFLSQVYFRDVQVAEFADFSDVKITGRASFRSVELGDANFCDSHFEGITEFSNCIIKEGSFNQARFLSLVNFKRSSIGEDVSFDAARFLGAHRIVRKAWLYFLFWCLVTTACAMISAYLSGFGAIAFASFSIFSCVIAITWTGVGGTHIADGDQNLMDSQVAMRSLRKVGRQSLNFELEALAHATEMKYSRLRLGSSIGAILFSKPSERLTSILYEGLGDYGRSLFRPFIWLFVLIFAMAGVYYNWAGLIDEGILADKSKIWMALEFSWSNTFRPFSALSTNDDLNSVNAVSASLLYGGGDAQSIDQTGVAVRIVASFQSLTAIVLLFLSALAIRRRFQIN